MGCGSPQKCEVPPLLYLNTQCWRSPKLWGALRIIGTVSIIVAGLPQYTGICIRTDAPGKWGYLQGKMVPCKMDNFRATGPQKCEMTQWCPGAGGCPKLDKCSQRIGVSLSLVIPKGCDGGTHQVPPGKKAAPKTWGTPVTDKHRKL